METAEGIQNCRGVVDVTLLRVIRCIYSVLYSVLCILLVDVDLTRV